MRSVIRDRGFQERDTRVLRHRPPALVGYLPLGGKGFKENCIRYLLATGVPLAKGLAPIKSITSYFLAHSAKRREVLQAPK